MCFDDIIHLFVLRFRTIYCNLPEEEGFAVKFRVLEVNLQFGDVITASFAEVNENENRDESKVCLWRISEKIRIEINLYSLKKFFGNNLIKTRRLERWRRVVCC